MDGQAVVENRMADDAQWDALERIRGEDRLPVCDCCEERIIQEEALHIIYGKKRVWLCDRCIRDLTEPTGYMEGQGDWDR